MDIKKLQASVQGYKSYIVIGIGIVSAIAQHYFNVDVPPQFYAVLLAFLGITLKAGQNRIEDATNALLDAIDQENTPQEATTPNEPK